MNLYTCGSGRVWQIYRFHIKAAVLWPVLYVSESGLDLETVSRPGVQGLGFDLGLGHSMSRGISGPHKTWLKWTGKKKDSKAVKERMIHKNLSFASASCHKPAALRPLPGHGPDGWAVRYGNVVAVVRCSSSSTCEFVISTVCEFFATVCDVSCMCIHVRASMPIMCVCVCPQIIRSRCPGIIFLE